MGDQPGHEFRGNQYGDGGGSPAQQTAVESAKRELASYTSAKSAYLAKNAQAFFPTKDGPDVPMGSPHQCYANAARAAAADPKLTYVEGVAIANTGHRGSLELTPHAWVVDRSGKVADPTPTVYRIVAYLGVKIPTSELPTKVAQGQTPLSTKIAWGNNPPKRAGG